MKKILFILFVAQFILAPYIIKGYGANLVEDNYEYSGVDRAEPSGNDFLKNAGRRRPLKKKGASECDDGSA